MGDEYLWPARTIAEYAYCPRLFYLMEVDGIHLPSTDTVKGIAVHKRVDKPSSQSPSVLEGTVNSERPFSIRSLTLTSKSLELTATLDLAEISGKTALPIEYRKGHPCYLQNDASYSDSTNMAQCDIKAHPWPVDIVHIGLQALLLKEAGYEVTKGSIYYASEKLRLDVDVNETMLFVAKNTLSEAKKCASGPRPLPLFNDNRCTGCSLQPVCLPDEINYERESEYNKKLTARRIWPPRDDGIHVVAQSDGTKIGIRGESLHVTDTENNIVKELPLVNIESLSLLGSVQLTTQAIHVLARKGIPIAYLSGVGRLICIVDPLDAVSAAVRRAQILQFDKQEFKLSLARALINAKIINQRRLLLRNSKSIEQAVLNEMADKAANALSANNMDLLRGYEGQAANLYFQNFGDMIKNSLGEEFSIHGRQRRPPPDPINSCLSLAYTMLTHECVSALRLASLEPSVGALHVSRPGRPALALDLMEPFRPLIADSIALIAFNRGDLKDEHFRRTAEGCVFTDAGRRIFFELYSKRMNTDITHPVFGYRLSYRRMLILHARMIAAWCIGEIHSLSFLTTR